jgi:undecaprenyl-diphosphatase
MSSKQKIKPSVLFALVIVLLLSSFFLDSLVFDLMPELRLQVLDTLFLFLTHIGLVIALFIILPCIMLVSKKQQSEIPFLLTAAASFSLIGILLKMAVSSQRPSQELFTFFGPFQGSFPSLHALVVCAMLPLIIRHFPSLRYVFMSMAALISFTRIYFGVHYLSDVVWGAFLGFGLGWYAAQDHGKNKFSITAFELRRKAFHVLFGIALAILIYLDHLNALWLGFLLAIGVALSVLEKIMRLPVLSSLLDTFERDEDRYTFPAKGMLLFLGGAFLVTVLFPKDIALASIMVLSLGDAFAHIFGVQFGKVRNPFSEHRFIEGVFAGIIAGFFGALFFVPALHALVAATSAMLVEAIEFNIPPIQVDDNLLVPLVAGASLLLMGMA